MVARVCRLVAALALTAIAFQAAAQVIPPSEQPGRERERFQERSPPRAVPGGAAISLPSSTAPPGAKQTMIVVQNIRVVGSTVYSGEQLAPLYRDLIGKNVSLQAIYDVARRITAKYGADGYVLSRAIVPVQNLDPNDATVRIEVIEGYINKVIWPQSVGRYRDFFSDYAAHIVAERPINVRTLERYLLLASDLPGLRFTTTLRPAENEPGASTLSVEVTEKPVDLFGRVDNRGTAARGPYQFLGSTTINNVAGAHEALTISYAGVWPLRELQYIAASYRQVLSSDGLTFFADASYSWGRPGTEQLEVLNFKTRSTVAEVGASYPIIRAREQNLTVSGLAFASDSYSTVFDAAFNTDRLRGVRLKTDADIADRLFGINQFNVTYSHGISGLGSTTNGNLFASRAAGRVDFSKIEGYAGRTQPLTGPLSAFAAVYGQYGFTSLLSPEQCGYGGRSFGRAFDPSQFLGDHCIQLLGELRYDLPPIASWVTQTQLYAFSDYGNLHTIAPSPGTAANVDAASIGAGLRLGWLGYLNADLSVAKGIEGPRDDWRFFFIATARY